MALEKKLITDVVYFHDLTLDRVAEANKCAERYGFRAHFGRDWIYSKLPEELEFTLGPEDCLWVPTVRDTHAQHAEVSKLGRQLRARYGCKLTFYTVDMESFQVPLPLEARELKRKALLELYPSQASLFQNEKYFLFEGYSDIDHVVGVKIKKSAVTVVLKGYNPPADVEDPKPDEQDVDYLNRLVANHYHRMSVNHIAVYRGNNSVEFNG